VCKAPRSTALTLPDPDAQTIYLHQLIAQARQCQQQGDLQPALRFAREALYLRADCSAIHALLGQLYEQIGDEVSARYHFREALSVEPGPVCADMPADPLPQPVRSARAGWMTWMLIGCILVSGMAIFITFWSPERHNTAAAVWQDKPSEPRLPAPQWSWENTLGNDGHSALVMAPVVPDALPPEDPAPTHDTPAIEPAVLPAVLGPTARTRVPVGLAVATQDVGDKAYFNGDFERAVTVYEELLRRDDPNGPRLHQDAAWCYQQLGNSEQAVAHLQRAVTGYQAVMEKEPANSAAKQGLEACKKALQSLTASRPE
jgi:Flp pilus assembly protein TadD